MYPGTPTPPSESPPAEPLPPLRDLFRVIWKRMWVIVVVLILCVGASLGFSIVQPPAYESSIKLLVGQEREADTPGDLGGEVQGLQQFTQTMTTAVETRPVADAVIGRLSLGISSEAFLRNLDAEQIGATQFIQVTYTDPNPEQARRIVNAVGEVFSEQVSGVSPGNNDLTAVVWERATSPGKLVAPDTLRNTLLALLLGLLLGVSLVFLLENLDNSWRSLDELEQVSGVPTLGVITRSEISRGKARRSKKQRER